MPGLPVACRCRGEYPGVGREWFRSAPGDLARSADHGELVKLTGRFCPTRRRHLRFGKSRVRNPNIVPCSHNGKNLGCRSAAAFQCEKPGGGEKVLCEPFCPLRGAFQSFARNLAWGRCLVRILTIGSMVPPAMLPAAGTVTAPDSVRNENPAVGSTRSDAKADLSQTSRAATLVTGPVPVDVDSHVDITTGKMDAEMGTPDEIPARVGLRKGSAAEVEVFACHGVPRSE